MHRITLWIFSAATLAAIGVLVAYQLSIGTKYLPPLSLSGAGSSSSAGAGAPGGGGGGKPSMDRIQQICQQVSEGGSLPGN